MGGSAFLIRNPYVYVYTYVHKNAYSSRYCEQKPKYLEDFSSICGVYGRALCLRHKLRQSRRLPTDNKKTEFCEVLNCIYSQIHTHTHTHFDRISGFVLYLLEEGKGVRPNLCWIFEFAEITVALFLRVRIPYCSIKTYTWQVWLLSSPCTWWK